MWLQNGHTWFGKKAYIYMLALTSNIQDDSFTMRGHDPPLTPVRGRWGCLTTPPGGVEPPRVTQQRPSAFCLRY